LTRLKAKERKKQNLLKKKDKDKKPAMGYWEIHQEGSENEQKMINQFKLSEVRHDLRKVLMVYPREEIRYTCLENALKADVRYINKMVSKMSDSSMEKFKVVSVPDCDNKEIVQKNFIYYKKKDGQWRLITSVDFDQHGSAPPGHWHLNRSPDGSIMEHWGASLSGIFHGNPKKCPFWWLLIPEGKRYKKKPDRPPLLET